MSQNELLPYNINVTGEGFQPMIFAHGLGCDQNMWRYVTPSFKKDYKIVLFDFIGSGKSDCKRYDKLKYSSLEGYADDLLEIAEQLQLRDIIFVGHSVSSMIGILASIKKPEIFSKLILVAPSPSYINDKDYIGGFDRREIEGLLKEIDENYENWAHSITKVIMQNDDRPELQQELEESFCRTDPQITRHFAEVTFLSDNRKDLEKVTVPSLTLQCSEDVIAPREIGEYLERNLKNNILHVMNATGHCPQLSAPEETITAIQNYLSVR